MSALAGTITAPLTVRADGLARCLRAALSLLIAAGVLAVALPVAFGSGTAGAGASQVQVLSSGELLVEAGGGARLSVAGMVPGQSRSATIRVSNAGSGAAALSLAMRAVDRVGAGGAPLSEALTLRVPPSLAETACDFT